MGRAMTDLESQIEMLYDSLSNRMPCIESTCYTTETLAQRVSLSKHWVTKWRPFIIGAQQIGRRWLFPRAVIDPLLKKGGVKAIINYPISRPRRKYIRDVHGAMCGKGAKHGTK